MDYSGEVHVFDFDDTLMWTQDWHAKAELDSSGYVIDPGNSNALKSALNLLKSQNFKLKKDISPQLDGRDTYFLVTDSLGNPVKKDELLNYFSEQKLEKAKISGSSKYSEYAAVTNDDGFYERLDTVGGLGANKEMLDLYQKHLSDAVILTARKDCPGMRETIDHILTEAAGSPQHIYVQPIDSKGSGLFKGEVLIEIASQPAVDRVYFYDDNMRYIQTINSVIKKHDLKHETNLSEKIDIYHVDTEDKPNFKIAKSLIEVASQLDKKSLFKEANLIDNLIYWFLK